MNLYIYMEKKSGNKVDLKNLNKNLNEKTHTQWSILDKRWNENTTRDTLIMQEKFKVFGDPKKGELDFDKKCDIRLRLEFAREVAKKLEEFLNSKHSTK